MCELAKRRRRMAFRGLRSSSSAGHPSENCRGWERGEGRGLGLKFCAPCRGHGTGLKIADQRAAKAARVGIVALRRRAQRQVCLARMSCAIACMRACIAACAFRLRVCPSSMAEVGIEFVALPPQAGARPHGNKCR